MYVDNMIFPRVPDISDVSLSRIYDNVTRKGNLKITDNFIERVLKLHYDYLEIA